MSDEKFFLYVEAKQAIDVGSCNVCEEIDFHVTVFQVHIRGTSFRLCNKHRKELIRELLEKGKI